MKSLARRLFLIGCLSLGVFAMLISVHSYFDHQRKVLSFASSPAKKPQLEEKFELPTKLKIKSLDLSLDVSETEIKEGVWQIPETGVGHLDTSARPGQDGNIVIYGHNYQTILGNLQKVKVGDELSIETPSGKKYDFTVTLKREVQPTQLAYVSPRNYPLVTIYTCSGILDTKRLIVQAVPKALL